MKYYLLLMFALLYVADAFSQTESRFASYQDWDESHDTMKPDRKSVTLGEFVVSENGFKRYRRAPRSENIHFAFRKDREDLHRHTDSMFDLTPVPQLSARGIQLREIRLRMKPWDTTRLHLNMIVLQVRNGDTVYTIRPLDMSVNKGWLSVRVEGEAYQLQPGPFYIGYSVSAFRVPEAFMYRIYGRTVTNGNGVLIVDGKLGPQPASSASLQIPLELGFDEL